MNLPASFLQRKKPWARYLSVPGPKAFLMEAQAYAQIRLEAAQVELDL